MLFFFLSFRFIISYYNLLLVYCYAAFEVTSGVYFWCSDGVFLPLEPPRCCMIPWVMGLAGRRLDRASESKTFASGGALAIRRYHRKEGIK